MSLQTKIIYFILFFFLSLTLSHLFNIYIIIRWDSLYYFNELYIKIETEIMLGEL